MTLPPHPSLSPPLGSLDADHPHVLRVVRQLAAEALVMKNRSNVVPVVLRHTASDGQVVRIAWSGEKERVRGVIKGRRDRSSDKWNQTTTADRKISLKLRIN